MIKTDVKNFILSTESYRDIPATLPASVFGALSAAGTLPDVYFADNARQYAALASEKCTLTAEFTIDTLSLSMQYSLLVLHRIDAPCTVELNGNAVAVINDSVTELSVNVKDKVIIGKNVLKIVFLPEHRESGVIRERLSRLTVGKCSILCYNDDIISCVHVERELFDDFVRLHLSVDTHEMNGTTRAVATLVSPGGRVYYCGLMNNYGYIDITEPNYWWPNGLGVQNLYKLTVNLYRDSEIVDSRDIKVGLSRFESVDRMMGKIPHIYVNGVSLYSRGACYLPDDALIPMLDKTRVEDLLNKCRDSCFNTVVVRDYSYFPEKHFFDVCDELGLVAWVEINCSDLDGERLSELLGLIERASYHTSFGALVLTGKIDGEIDKAFSDCAPEKIVMCINDLDRELLDSFPSLPSTHTVLSFSAPEEANIFSPNLEFHSTLADNKELIRSEMYRFPLGLSELSYVTQMSEASSLTEKINKVRQERDRTLHTVLPRLSDPWGQISPSSIDSRGRWKAQQYFLRSLFAPVTVGAFNDGTRVTFFVSNEQKSEYNGKLSYAVCDASGEVIFRDGFAISVPKNSSSDILTIDLFEAVAGKEDRCFVTYSISDGIIVTSKGTLLFTTPKRFSFIKPNIDADITGNGNQFTISIRADVFVHGLEIGFDEFDAVFEDNYIDIIDRSPVRIEFTTDKAVAAPILRRQLVLRSSYDIGRK